MKDDFQVIPNFFFKVDYLRAFNVYKTCPVGAYVTFFNLFVY